MNSSTPIVQCEPEVEIFGLIVIAAVLVTLGRFERAGANHPRGPNARPQRIRTEPKLRLRVGSLQRVRGPRLQVRLSERRQVSIDDEHSLLVVGPTRSGKTTRVVLPNLCSFPGSLVATSVKTDLLTTSVLEARKQRGRVVIIGDRALATHHWDLVCEAVNERAALAMAHALVLAQPGFALTSGDTQFWYQLAEPIVAALLRSAALTGAGMLAGIDDPGELYRSLVAHGEQRLANGVLAACGLEERQRDSVLLTARGLVNPLVNVETTLPQVRVSELIDGPPSATFLIASTADQELFSLLFAVLLSRIVAVALERRRMEPLLVCLDELANLAPIPNLDRLAAVGVGQGVRLISIVQDLSQLEHRYGRGANSIINNHASKLFLSSTADPITRAYLRDIAPESLGSRQPLLMEGSSSMSRLWVRGQTRT
jgi:type IV secretion system protein VirD4